MFKHTYSFAMFIIFVVANAVLFLATGIKHELEFWVSYGFVVFAYITLWFSAFRQKDSSMEYFFAITRIRLNIIYVLCALIAALLVYNFAVDNKAVFYGVQAAVAVVFIVIMLFLTDVDDTHADLELAHSRDCNFTKQAKKRIAIISEKNTDLEIEHKIDNLIDILSTSPESRSSICDEYEETFNVYLADLETDYASKPKEVVILLLDRMTKELRKRNDALICSK